MQRLESAYGASRIRIGLDIHGVIDQAPKFFSIFANLPDVFEVHIITGIKEELDDVVDFSYEKWFSIHQQCEDEGIEIQLDDKSRPWVDPAIWDVKKAEYCEREGIHIMIDDSPSYGKYFAELETLYLRLENTRRDNWRADGQHVDSPNDPDAIDVKFQIPGAVVRTCRTIARAGMSIFNMMKWFKNSVRPYWVMPSRLYDYDERVDKAVIHMIDNCEFTGMTKYNALFKDPKTGIEYSVWIENKMYGYASSGGRGGTRIWNSAQPSRKTCVRLFDLVSKAKTESFIK